jgi:hypothetical protein
MALRPCQYSGQRLPDNETCGGLCSEFPACLPAPSPELVAEVARLRIEAESEQASYLATSASLMLIHEALVAGLERKSDAGDH